jgi:hypothetical protein
MPPWPQQAGRLPSRPRWSSGRRKRPGCVHSSVGSTSSTASCLKATPPSPLQALLPHRLHLRHLAGPLQVSRIFLLVVNGGPQEGWGWGWWVVDAHHGCCRASRGQRRRSGGQRTPPLLGGCFARRSSPSHRRPPGCGALVFFLMLCLDGKHKSDHEGRRRLSSDGHSGSGAAEMTEDLSPSSRRGGGTHIAAPSSPRPSKLVCDSDNSAAAATMGGRGVDQAFRSFCGPTDLLPP